LDGEVLLLARYLQSGQEFILRMELTTACGSDSLDQNATCCGVLKPMLCPRVVSSCGYVVDLRCHALLTRYWEDTELMGKISAKLRDMKLAGGGQQQQAAGKPSKVRRRSGAGDCCGGCCKVWAVRQLERNMTHAVCLTTDHCVSFLL
jgi:hypothetical protein